MTTLSILLQQPLDSTVLVALITATATLAGVALGSILTHVFASRREKAKWEREKAEEKARWEREIAEEQARWERQKADQHSAQLKQLLTEDLNKSWVFCTHCGTKHPAGLKFCPMCGSPRL